VGRTDSAASLNPDAIAGVDEAGRGPLAGPVVVAAVMLPDDHGLDALDDSKKLNETARESLFDPIRRIAVAWHIETVSVAEIETHNILQATLRGMARAVRALDPAPEQVLVDGNRTPDLLRPCRAIIGGDGLEACISAASILAKVHRDRLMVAMETRYPGYGFARHKGYPTPMHMERLETLGPCPEHRRTFAPVRRLLEPGLFD
jgi:ribonuclease HII